MPGSPRGNARKRRGPGSLAPQEVPSSREGLRILFVNGVLEGDFSALDIGVTVLATFVNRMSPHRAEVCDLTFHSRDWERHLQDRIAGMRPDVVALSCNTMYMKYVRRIVAQVRRVTTVPVLLGGHHATVSPEDAFAIPGVGAVIRGDGEDALVEYLDRLQGGGGFDGVPGLWVKTGDGTEIRNEGVGYTADLDRLPWLDWDLWEDLDRYLYFFGMLYVQGSRGCPYQCTFCDAQGYAGALKKAGRYFRLRSPEAFAQELAHYHERYANRGLRLFQVFDPVFTMDDRWLEAFCAEYRRLGLADRIRFSAFSRIDHLTEDKIRLLARSGCGLLRVGIESGNDRIRMEVFRKRIDTERIRRINRLAREHGIHFTAFYILGGPEETRGTFCETIRLAWELDAARSAFFVYKPFTEEGRAQFEGTGGGVDERRYEAANNITWGGTTFGKDWGPRTVEAYQFVAYALTFGRRWVRMVGRRRMGYLKALVPYMARGLVAGLDWRYLMMYFHIYEGDNIDR